MKALLVSWFVRPKRTHDLTELLHAMRQNGIDLGPLDAECESTYQACDHAALSGRHESHRGERSHRHGGGRAHRDGGSLAVAASDRVRMTKRRTPSARRRP